MATLAVLLAAVGAVQAQTYPTQTIRIIVPFPAGGLNDVLARLIQPHLERGLGQTVIVENRPGASGIVGTDLAAKAAPDGHTLLMIASTHTVNPAVNSKLPYDTERDLAPIALVAQNPLMFLINPKVEARTLQDFVIAAKANPAKFNYATPGAASQAHLVIELFNKRAGLTMQHIPYRGGAPAILSTVAGDTQFTVVSPLAAFSQIQAGGLRPVAVGSLQRDPQFSAVPTVAESGYQGFEAMQWVGLLTAGATPKAVIDRINAEVNKALSDPETVAKMQTQGTAPAGGSAEDFRKRITSEIRDWIEVAKTSNIKAE
jgi:tripartite-type tricarboxylate transporter receptor subunit TctC